MKKVSVIGLGNFGSALLNHLDRKNNGAYSLHGYSRNKEMIQKLKKERSRRVTFGSDLELAVSDADYLVFAVTSSAVPEVIQHMKNYLQEGTTIVNTAKALDYTTGKPLSVIAARLLKGIHYNYAVLVGATIAQDLLKGIPLGINVASKNPSILIELTSLFQSKNLTVLPTQDLIGAEYASAFKNVIAIFSGMMHGIGYALESEIFAMTQAAAEVENLVIYELGGKRETFILSTPCWGNDLWMSCTSNTRNRELGILLGQGLSVKNALIHMKAHNKTVEGVYTIQVLNKITDLRKYPYLQFVYDFFSEHATLHNIKELLKNKTT